MQSGLERIARQYRWVKGNKKYEKNPLEGLADVERRMLTRFRREAHQTGVDIPEERISRDLSFRKNWWRNLSPVEWLALLQHHGGCTRLLDFTRSFWHAVFFAIQPSEYGGHLHDANSRKDPVRQAVWAIETRQLRTRALCRVWKQEFREDDGRIPEHTWLWRCALTCRQGMRIDENWEFAKKPRVDQTVAVPVEPERVNVRMGAQAGCFLFPLNANRPFQENLFGTFDLAPSIEDLTPDPPGGSGIPESWKGVSIVKILVPQGCDGKKHMELIRDEQKALQEMNITRASLFPGLDGLAMSTAIHIWD